MAVLPRDLEQRIVADLAKNHRTVSAIAARHHVPVQVVETLRDLHGPGIPQLIAAAAMLRKPVVTPASEPDAVVEPTPDTPDAPDAPDAVTPEPTPAEAAEPKRLRWDDGLTPAQRHECRTWCNLRGVEVGSYGQVSKSALEAWTAAGRPPVYDVVDQGVVEDDDLVDATIADTLTPLGGLEVLEVAQVALLDVQGILTYASVHVPAEVWDLVHACNQLVDVAGAHRVEARRVQYAVDVLLDALESGQLTDGLDALRDVAQRLLQAVDAA